ISSAHRNVFLAISGLALSYYFNDLDIVHPLTTCLVTWLLCKIMGDWMGMRKAVGSVVFVWNFGYLMWGYYMTSTDDYDIGWTMQQCVQCLRLIGFGMDYGDGRSQFKKAPVETQHHKPKDEIEMQNM